MENTIDALYEDILNEINKVIIRHAETKIAISEIIDAIADDKDYPEKEKKIQNLTKKYVNETTSIDTAADIKELLRKTVKKYDFSTIRAESNQLIKSWQIDEVEDMLKQWGGAASSRKRINEKIKECFDMMKEPEGYIKSHTNDRMPHSTEISDPTYKSVEKMLEYYKSEIDKQRELLDDISIKEELIELMLTHITPREKKVLEYLYLKKMNWIQISMQIAQTEKNHRISDKTCMRDKSSAIEKIYRKLNE